MYIHIIDVYIYTVYKYMCIYIDWEVLLISPALKVLQEFQAQYILKSSKARMTGRQLNHPKTRKMMLLKKSAFLRKFTHATIKTW